MSFLQRNPRFFASTRGKIVTLLRRTSRTVEELAQALDLTDNAVRAQLATLERDGLVQQHGRRRSSSKPASVYDLTPAAEELFSKAYGPVLRQLLDELNERMTAEEVDRKSTRLNSSHGYISYAVFCLKKIKSGTCVALRSQMSGGSITD